MVTRKPGRYLAPVALIAVLVAVIVVVGGAGGGTSHHAATTAVSHQLPDTHHAAPQPIFYVIKSGDSLSGISVKTGVQVATLEALNPSIDPNALQTGQRIRLRR